VTIGSLDLATAPAPGDVLTTPPKSPHHCPTCEVGWDAHIAGPRCWSCDSPGDPGSIAVLRYRVIARTETPTWIFTGVPL